MNVRRQDRGFTLIEIVLVLAVAGFILAAVFLAVSGAQRAQRDSQRKHDAAALVAAVQQYAANNQLQQPLTQAEADTLMAQYFQNRVDPKTGVSYVLHYYPAPSTHDISKPAIGHLVLFAAHICGSETGAATLVDTPPGAGGHDPRRYAVIMALEVGEYQCISGEN